MAMTPADARFYFQRVLGLAHRALSSLRTRGWSATMARAKARFAPGPGVRADALFNPAATPFAPFALPGTLRAGDAAPRASIVIPVYGKFPLTLACLRALAAHPPANGAEVIVVDDGSPDDTGEHLPRIDGLRYHRRATNGGFIAACNDGASLARGEYIVFLNNDTIPQPGWLDALLRTFDEHPDAGLAGARLVLPDGRLQEAGGVVRNDGHSDNIGRFASPAHPLYAYVRRVDYCSGAAIALPTADFRAHGGFHQDYAPAYYEDTDLGFRVRAAGKSVYVQPAADVLHFEGGTAGTDVREGPKAAQVRNREVLLKHWQHTLVAHPGHDVAQAELSRHHFGKQVLIVDAETPTPDRDSGSLRMINLMRLLREEGAHVVFLPANARHDGAYTEALQQLGVETWYAPFAGNMPAWFREHGPRFDTIVLCRHYVASEMLPLARKYAPQARVVFDTIDLHYLRERRGADVAGDAALRRSADRTRALELDCIARSDATLVVSDVERALLAQDAPGARVEILSNLHRVAGPGQSFAHREDLVFVGGFRHPPNVDAVSWFVRDVFPLVRARLPVVRFHCIGGHVPESILALGAIDGVVVHGHVPDIEPYMQGARIALAPLRYGAGVKGKVNLSMAHGQPVVATSCAVEGMHLRDGEDVLVGDEPAAFADAIVRLYSDEALWTRLRDAALVSVEKHFSVDAARDVVRRILLGA
ncbi:glycosyltransferase [Lysobacter sp. A6]|uniref:Glycosyltransferase n=1 Tax=Noviluteimonas lactosilytica TaxID=2888523 RepID=A0ABS8JFN4_9GAMM|nr:glycosyltransferase [Lysobacter lactosilyticus]MCC8362401.1 glycosyltransferase [Lysobacter lactosilyticus]